MFAYLNERHAVVQFCVLYLPLLCALYKSRHTTPVDGHYQNTIR